MRLSLSLEMNNETSHIKMVRFALFDQELFFSKVLASKNSNFLLFSLFLLKIFVTRYILSSSIGRTKHRSVNDLFKDITNEW